MKFARLSLIPVLVLALTPAILQAQAPNFHWGAGWGGPNFDPAHAVATDSLGNVITVGAFLGNADMDPGIGTYFLGARGANDIFVQKMDANGNFLWAKSVGDVGIDVATSVDVDGHGNIYLTGYFEDLVDFDPDVQSSFRLKSQGASDFFILKLDPAGNFLWAKSIGSGSWDWGERILLDGKGFIYLTGYHSGQTDFDPDTSRSLLLSSNGQSDAFVMKMDTSGSLIWARSYGGSSYDFGWDLALDSRQNLYVAGYFENTVDFDPDTAVINRSSAGGRDLYLLKLDSAGRFLWVRNTGGNKDDRAQACAVDAWDNVYLGGYFETSVDLDPGVGMDIRTSAGGRDIFILKFDSLGAIKKVLTTGAAYNDEVRTLLCDGKGNLLASGYFKDSVDFDFGSGVQKLPNSFFDEAFIISLDSSANLNWLGAIGGPEDDAGHHLHLDNRSNIYLAGSFEARADLNPFSGTRHYQTRGRTDAFVTKLIPCSFTDTAISLTSCGPFKAPDGRILQMDGKYISIIDNASGCDSIISIDLKIAKVEYDSIRSNACDSFLLPSGKTYLYSSQSLNDTLISSFGCDSILFIDVNINYSSSIRLADTACVFYVSPAGKLITQSMSLTDTLLSLGGCDSILQLDVVINAVDTSVMASRDSLESRALMARYQWLDCNNAMMSLPGDTFRIFVPQRKGVYAVEVHQNGCVDTSSCYSMNSVGFEEQLRDQSWLKYLHYEKNILLSNPSKSIASISIYDSRGRMVWKSSLKAQHSRKINAGAWESGIYSISIQAGEFQLRDKIILSP